MRKGCERRRASEIGIVDSCNDLGAMAWAVALELNMPRHWLDKIS